MNSENGGNGTDGCVLGQVGEVGGVVGGVAIGSCGDGWWGEAEVVVEGGLWAEA